ncbi:MAG: hypothetical protein EOP06_20785 [Proteobacteria bacterium]|nr:MAG: hypothetical protein EOP06_20785 [Pseudomonadota bacterium]
MNNFQKMKINTVISRIAKRLHHSSKEGLVRDWYQSANYWQSPLRHNAAIWRAMVTARNPEAQQYGLQQLHTVNARYKTRAANSDLQAIYNHSLSVLLDKQWFDNAPSFYESDSDIEEIADTYMATLLDSCNDTKKRNFSLVSKWLHFCLPDTFPIYDQQVVSSIKAWSDVAHTHLPLTNLERLQYNIEHRHWVTHWQNPMWYLSILKFYRQLWDEIIRLELADDITRYASEIEEDMKLHKTNNKYTMTVASLMDTHLWLANGNMSKLASEQNRVRQI